MSELNEDQRQELKEFLETETKRMAIHEEVN